MNTQTLIGLGCAIIVFISLSVIGDPHIGASNSATGQVVSEINDFDTTNDAIQLVWLASKILLASILGIAVTRINLSRK